MCKCASIIQKKYDSRKIGRRNYHCHLHSQCYMYFYLSKSSTNAQTECIERGQKEFLVLAVTFDMLIPKITLFSQYICARLLTCARVLFFSKDLHCARALTSASVCTNPMEKKPACISAAAAAVHNIIQQSQPSNLHTPSS